MEKNRYNENTSKVVASTEVGKSVELKICEIKINFKRLILGRLESSEEFKEEIYYC